MTVLPYRTISAYIEAVRAGRTTARQMVDATLEQIETQNSGLNAYREVFAEEARAAADRIDEQVARGADPGPLAGAPISIKDNIATTLGRTSAGSKMLADYRSPFNATAVERLIDAGAIIIGKVQCDEFGMGSSGENCAFGPTRNPHDEDRVAGGSSSGSAAAVAAGLCLASIGSDTGGSVRLPASFCGVVGVKPTYGRVSRYGLVAYGSSLDCIGPITNSVNDAAMLLQIMAGHDPRDATSSTQDVFDFNAEITQRDQPMRLAVPSKAQSDKNDDAVNDAFARAVDHFRATGAEIIEVDFSLADYGLATYYILAPAEASSNLARYDGIRYGHRTEPVAGDALDDLYARSRAEGFGEEVKRRIMLGTFVLSSGYHDAYYLKALKARRLIHDAFTDVFSQCDAMLTPTASMPA
ncbi:MAG: Asp-tRNA(Asn)/Glu-tRNA(Gln) amidotransferase subunit GatA, partial [Phycisphaerales bacterium]